MKKNGTTGFAIFRYDNTILEDNIWTLDEAIEIAKRLI